MYYRELTEPPVQIIENKKANFGTYKDVCQKLDIKGMFAPYAGVPVPAFISNLRIKSRLNYIFNVEKYIGLTEFFDFKIFGFSNLIIFDKESGKKYNYFNIMGPKRRYIPTNTEKGSCISYKKTRYIKVSWGRNHQHLALRFNVHGDSLRPDIKGHFFSPMTAPAHTDALFVNPSPAASRCSATWLTTMNIQGELTFSNGASISSEGLAAMMINRTYYKLRTFSTLSWGMGTVKDKNIVFQLKNSNMDAAQPDKYNDNILIIDGVETALPSVYMTHPFGINKDWIIQDTESMVDLTFTPISMNNRVRNIIAMRFNHTIIYGTYTGVLLDKDGNKVVLKNFPGIINRNTLRL